ncbi:MAG TPA: hypothetical protein VFC78_15515 [Tepidisphaeraceae bacterium]|nr:hypothetical protein [Tepidisphaeraceae bacterium]
MRLYEEELDSDVGIALREGSMHFEEKSRVHDALREVTRRLDELDIPYAVAGGMALFLHDYRRFTEDVDILVNADGLRRLHEQLEGLGYVAPFAGSKNLRDTARGVKIEFLVSGQFPGDGKPKPVAFPEPSDSSVEISGIRVLGLPQLIELKLASGITAPNRLKDLADVQELISVLKLPRTMADQINPFVRDKYLEFWNAIAASPAEQD